MSSASPALPGSTKSAARMLDVTGLVAQSDGGTTENGPSASRPLASLSSALGAVCSGTAPPCGLPAMPACGLSMPACGLSMPACGLSMPACGLGGAVVAAPLLPAGAVPDCQSVAGGRSPLGVCFLHEAPKARVHARAISGVQ